MKRKVNSLEEAIADYESIVGDRIFYGHDEQVNVYVTPNYHFMVWAILEEDGEPYFWIGECYGRFFEFVSYMDRVLELNHIDKIVCSTPRNTKPFIRKWHMERLPNHDFVSDSGIKYKVLTTTRKHIQRFLKKGKEND